MKELNNWNWNTSQQIHVAAADEMRNWLDYEVQHRRMRELSAQHAKQLQEEEDWKSQQSAKAIAKLEELNSHSSIQSQKVNDAPPEADNLHCKQKAGGNGTTKHDTSTADTSCIFSAENLNLPLPANRLRNITVPITSTPASKNAGVSKGSLIHNVISSAKNTEINMMEHNAHESTSQSHDSSALKHWQMENRRWQVDLLERIIRERSKIAEITEYANEIPADIRSAEAKPHVDLATRDKNSRRDAAAVLPASPPVFGNEKNTAEVSSVHKTQVVVVVFSSSIIPAQVTSVPGVTVGSIMLGDVSLASVQQKWAAAAKEVHDAADSQSRPQQTKKSGKDQNGVLPVENPLRNDSVMCTPIKQPSKKEQPQEGGMNLAAPTQPSGNHIIGWENVAIAARTGMERFAHKPVCKEPPAESVANITGREPHRI